MNKQEVIQKINDSMFSSRIIPLTYQSECFNQGMDTALKIISKLDQPQKVKVPEEFDEWYQQIKQQRGFSEMIARHFALWKICQFGFGHDFEDVSHERTPLDLSVWVSNHKDEAVHAILNGYEVEEETKWVVKSNRLYFTGITQLIARDPITYNFTTDENRAHVFDDKESAEKEASFFDGTVEKVEV